MLSLGGGDDGPAPFRATCCARSAQAGARGSVLDRERTIQSELASRVFAPLDALFSLLENSARR